MPLAPPPDGACFPTWEECFRAVQTHAAAEGYAVNSKGQAKSKATGLYRRYVIRCDKSGTFKSAATIGIRRMTSKKTDCPFSAACNIRPDGCFLRVLKPEHNHPPSALPAAHVQHRKLTDEQRQLVETRAVERKSIKLIWEELKSIDPSTYITFKDVDNAVQRFRKKAKDGATGVQAIIYKLVERQDLYCYTLEREGVIQGAFWVPRWSTDLWMRPNGTPDILVMLAEHIANRPVLPILEMNSVLNTAVIGNTAPVRALPMNPILPIDPNANTTPDNPTTGDNDESPGPAPNPASTSNEQNEQPATASGNGLDASLGAGYAILPDKTDATILWLRSAVEMLRQKVSQCPKPRFITLTDFQTSEKNILVEVSKGGSQHRQMHFVFGRILKNDEENQAHHGVKTRAPRVERGVGRNLDGTPRQGDGAEDDEDQNGEEDGDGDHEQGDDNDDEDEDEDGDNEDHDMDGDHDSDAEIARQLTSANAQHNNYNNYNQNSGHGYNSTPQRNPERLQQPNQNGLSSASPMQGRPSLPHPAPRHPSMQNQPGNQGAYNPMMSRIPGNNMMPGH